jgi:ATP/maltotriose-dependent transcriptional regulator MalT
MMATLIGAENVVGRDRLIATMWKKLETGSLLLTAERRIGKTTVMTRMRDSAPDDVRALYLDVEGLDSPAQFSAKLLQAVMPLLGAQTQAMTAIREVRKRAPERHAETADRPTGSRRRSRARGAVAGTRSG